MEALVNLLKTPEGIVACGIGYAIALSWVIGELRFLRRHLATHEKECAERWGQVRTKLNIQD